MCVSVCARVFMSIKLVQKIKLRVQSLNSQFLDTNKREKHIRINIIRDYFN